MNFHSSTLSSNFLLIMRELGARISARVVGGSSLNRGGGGEVSNVWCGLVGVMCYTSSKLTPSRPSFLRE